MRVRVTGARISEQNAKAKKRNKFRKKGSIFANKNGRIQLKDMHGKSYMKMGFYRLIPLKSEHMRIIDLQEEKKNHKVVTVNKIDSDFEFRKRADRRQAGTHQHNHNESRIGMLDQTGMAETDISQIGIADNSSSDIHLGKMKGESSHDHNRSLDLP